MRKTGRRATSISGGALALDSLSAHPEEGNVQARTFMSIRQQHGGRHGGRGRHGMVRVMGDQMPYPTPPNFPPPPPLACFDETSLGSEVNREMGYGTQTWATSTLSTADLEFSTQVEALGAQSISGNSESRAQVVALDSLVCV